MTQPPLSQAILALEEELSVTLFKRTKRNVALTPVGEHLLSHVTKLLEDVEALPGLARQLSRGEIGSLKLGFVTTADYNLLPDLISHYGATYPDVKPLVAAVPEEWVRRGRIELAQGRLRLQDVAEAPLVLFPRRSAPAFHDIITTYFVTNGIQPTIGQEAIQMQTIISLVSAGMGIALVPGSLKRLGRDGVVYVDLDGEPPMIETGLVWRRDDPSPTVTRLVEISQAIGEQAAAPVDDANDPMGACAAGPPVGGSAGVVFNGHAALESGEARAGGRSAQRSVLRACAGGFAQRAVGA
eukprot:jgi/Tetstr1/446555/TSEL_034080.t1